LANPSGQIAQAGTPRSRPGDLERTCGSRTSRGWTSIRCSRSDTQPGHRPPAPKGHPATCTQQMVGRLRESLGALPPHHPPEGTKVIAKSLSPTQRTPRSRCGDHERGASPRRRRSGPNGANPHESGEMKRPPALFTHGGGRTSPFGSPTSRKARSCGGRLIPRQRHVSSPYGWQHPRG
jgi:hypothetical protein